MKPTISVVIPVYNRFDLLKHAVNSVLAQTLPVIEVILVDDGSVDETPALLPRYIAGNEAWRDRVVYLHQENQGPNVARNNGIARARGEWLAFLDNDDLWLPQKLEWQFRALEEFKDECSACITDAWFMNNPYMKMTLFQLAGKRHGQPMGVITDPLQYMLKTNSIVGVHPVWLQNLVARTDIVRRIGGFDANLRFGDDDDFAFRLGCETKICFVSLPMVLIDRTPPAERHVGASKNWDNMDFRLHMAQFRFEKRLRMGQRLPAEVRRTVRRDLAAVHSGWANWFLQRREYIRARQALKEAAALHLTAGIAIKWMVTQFTPDLARKVVIARDRNRSRRNFGIG
jgi:glycosyltransferase involved in cell wall biosynthesis